MLWLETLGEAWEKTGWRIHAWVMMNNHYHPRSVKYKRARQEQFLAISTCTDRFRVPARLRLWH
jgi:hypothetical protein